MRAWRANVKEGQPSGSDAYPLTHAHTKNLRGFANLAGDVKLELGDGERNGDLLNGKGKV